MPAVGGIAKRAEIGIVRRDDQHLASIPDQAMEFFHGLHNVADMLDDMDRLQGIEGRIAERIGKMVEFANHIGPAGRIAIDADGAGKLVDSATDVEGSHVRTFANRERELAPIFALQPPVRQMLEPRTPMTRLSFSGSTMPRPL
jgi:hypothetical protein